MNRVVNKTIKKTATPRTGRVIDAAASKSVSVSEGAGGGLSHSHVNKALIDLINQGLSTESSVQFKDVVASGAMTAGSANGAIPDDLPAATDQVFGVVKLDGVTIKIDPETGRIYAEVSSGGVSSWNDLTDKPANLIAIAALTGAGLIKRNVDGTYSVDTTVYQTYDADLATIAAIADGVGYLKRTGQNTWVIDTNTYLTSITKGMVEAVLTGNITTHTHSQYLTAITKTMVEAVLTGVITSHQHNYMPTSGGNFTNPITVLGHTVWNAGNDGATSGLDADLLDGQQGDSYYRINLGNPTDNAGLLPNGLQYISAGNAGFGGDLPTTIEGTVANFNGFSKTGQALGFKLLVPTSVDKSLYYNSFYSAWRGWVKLYDTQNSNKKTVDWAAKNVNAVNVIADGAVTAGAANDTPPDDLPAATDTLFGVIKLGLSLIGSAGIANIRNRNYTTLSTYTDAAARMITSEIAIGSGTMVNTETISITLTNMPVSITKAPVGNIIANYSNWTGAGMKLSFARGGTYWLAFITNDLGTTITKDGIYISVQAMQLV